MNLMSYKSFYVMLDTWFHVNYGNEIRSDRQKRGE